MATTLHEAGSSDCTERKAASDYPNILARALLRTTSDYDHQRPHWHATVARADFAQIRPIDQDQNVLNAVKPAMRQYMVDVPARTLQPRVAKQPIHTLDLVLKSSGATQAKRET
jgi:hypothetical protein